MGCGLCVDSGYRFSPSFGVRSGGRLDREKLTRFLQEVRRADAQVEV